MIFFSAQELGCTNAEWPDLYGHYREARFTQTKHHWWWKLNHVFGNVLLSGSAALQGGEHTGLVLFIEEDHYVSEDFLVMLALMQKSQPILCPHCRIFTLGTYTKLYNYKLDSSKVCSGKP